MNATPSRRRALQRARTPVAALLAGSLASLAFAAPPNVRPDALLQIDMNRAAVVERIISSWSAELPSAQIDSLKAKLMGLRADQLLAANISGSFDGVLSVLHSQDKDQTLLQNPNTFTRNMSAGLIGSGDRVKAVGETDRDLVYTPVTPCRLFDTREAIGPLAAGAQRNLQVIASSFISQGGAATNCNVDPGAKAAVINVAVVFPTGQGHITVWPANLPVPVASSLNFAPTSVQVAEANGLIVPLCTTACPDSAEIAAQATHATHLIADVVGYFMPPNRNGDGLRVFQHAGSWVSSANGASTNVANQPAASVAGGANNQATAFAAGIAGGFNNQATSNYSTVAGGNDNVAGSTGPSAFVGAGSTNLASHGYSFIGSGRNNTVSGDNSSIVGGYGGKMLDIVHLWAPAALERARIAIATARTRQ